MVTHVLQSVMKALGQCAQICQRGAVLRRLFRASPIVLRTSSKALLGRRPRAWNFAGNTRIAAVVVAGEHMQMMNTPGSQHPPRAGGHSCAMLR